MANPGTDSDHDSSTATRERKKSKTRRPRRFKVLLHNDDYSTMEFVVHVLIEHFSKSPAEATHIMLQDLYKGAGFAGVSPRDIAVTKVAAVGEEAQAAGMPLLVTTEAE
jgi:ATP-dependent Clp protease adaptor protein ClpS